MTKIVQKFESCKKKAKKIAGGAIFNTLWPIRRQKCQFCNARNTKSCSFGEERYLRLIKEKRGRDYWISKLK